MTSRVGTRSVVDAVPLRCAALLLAVAVVATAACGGSRLRARNEAVGEMIAKARESGAMRCAPVELAKAEAHADFADQELDEGRYYAARDEVAIAERNARDAVRLSPPERCVDRQPVARPTIGDADGDGVLDDVDECPRQPEDLDAFQDADGCPEADNDADGLVDTADACPNRPEDQDQHEDADGCPDDDNDGDGFADAIDQCPNEPEDADGFEDDDGCPDCDNDGDGVLECPDVVDQCPAVAAKTADGCPEKYALVEIKKDRIELKQTVFFDTNRATIRRMSFALLDQVAQALSDNPSIEVRIEGHTDSRGAKRRNQALSEARAAAVRDYLVARGVAADRLASKGFGEDVPIADNRTKAGRELNRRVEFVIIRR